MSGRLQQDVERLIGEKTGRAAHIARQSAAGGGCINNAAVLHLVDGRSFFLKSNPRPLPRMFPCEAEGLAALSEPDVIRVPRPLGTGGEEDGGTPFIVMEYIESGHTGEGFFEDFGRRFALLHQKTQIDRYGFERDNYLGSTCQVNTWSDDWVQFWREHRFGYQLKLGRKTGHFDAKLERLLERVMDRLEELIGEPAEPGCLLHGDLWGGNYMADGEGRPVLIDPAVYYGRREADLAMTMIFGGFNQRFYSAYEEVWPLAEGSSARLDIYKLWHLLNHLNSFGGGYYGSSMSLLQRYA